MALDPFKHTAWRGGAGISLEAAEALVNAGLSARRSGTLPELMAQHPRIAAWLARRYLKPILGTAGDLLSSANRHAEGTALLLEWSIAQIRPDQEDSLYDIDRLSWLDRTSWRPMLALASHYGVIRIPEFSDRYRRRQDESVVDNLCGLWSVGPSTFYRYLDKGKRQVSELLLGQAFNGTRKLALRRHVHSTLLASRDAPDDAERRDWHARHAARAQEQRDCTSAMWHALLARDMASFIQILTRYRLELARDDETDALVARCSELPLADRERFDLQMAHAALWLARKSEDRAQQVFDQALKLANQVRDPLMLGIVCGALGKFHEPRDTDKALAYLEESADLLLSASGLVPRVSRDEVAAHYVATLQKLAWLYVLRNDPRSKAVLDRADASRSTCPLPDEIIALLEQTWGEYWRRSGNVRMAIARMHRALNLFERLDDTRQILSTFNNLSILYSEAREFEQAVDYAQRVLSFDGQVSIDAYVLASAHGNLGVAYFWLDRYEDAIAQYRAGLTVSQQADLRVQANRAHYNLAEAFYKRFKAFGDPTDELLGDQHAAEALKASPTEANPFHHDAVRNLKNELLGPSLVAVNERLIHEEFAVHAEEFGHVQQLRATLVLPGEARERVRSHLAIANAYLAISTKEREAALELIRQHGLDHEFDSEIDALQMTFSRELTKEKVLHAQWKQKSYGVLTEERASSVLKQVLESGSINKSGYAQLCQVGLATASKHLGTLAERGLLVQTGKGPSTRYVLPAT